jgi:hypothetical protein
MTIMRKYGDAGHRPQLADSATPAEPVDGADAALDPEDPQGLSRTAMSHLAAAEDLPEVEGPAVRPGIWAPEAP